MSAICVATYNIHKSIGSDGVMNERRTGDALVTLPVDLVSINEAYYYRNPHPNIHQGEYLRTRLEAAQGRTWYRYTLNTKAPGARSGYGISALSRYPFQASGYQMLTPGDNPRGIIRVAIKAPKWTNVFVTHLDYKDAAARRAETKEVLAYTAKYAQPHILMGDFNFRPGEAEYKLVDAVYGDAWAEAVTLGVATAWNTTGNTHGYRGGSRFDYCWLKGAPPIRKAEVLDMRVNGVWPSDHHPLVVTLQA